MPAMPKVEHVVPILRRAGEPAAVPDRFEDRRPIRGHLPKATVPKVTDNDETAMVMRYAFVLTLMGMAPAIVLLYLQYLHPMIAPVIE
jgi:hypothetical protein